MKRMRAFLCQEERAWPGKESKGWGGAKLPGNYSSLARDKDGSRARTRAILARRGRFRGYFEETLHHDLKEFLGNLYNYSFFR